MRSSTRSDDTTAAALVVGVSGTLLIRKCVCVCVHVQWTWIPCVCLSVAAGVIQSQSIDRNRRPFAVVRSDGVFFPGPILVYCESCACVRCVSYLPSTNRVCACIRSCSFSIECNQFVWFALAVQFTSSHKTPVVNTHHNGQRIWFASPSLVHLSCCDDVFWVINENTHNNQNANVSCTLRATDATTTSSTTRAVCANHVAIRAPMNNVNCYVHLFRASVSAVSVCLCCGCLGVGHQHCQTKCNYAFGASAALQCARPGLLCVCVFFFLCTRMQRANTHLLWRRCIRFSPVSPTMREVILAFLSVWLTGAQSLLLLLLDIREDNDAMNSLCWRYFICGRMHATTLHIYALVTLMLMLECCSVCVCECGCLVSICWFCALAMTGVCLDDDDSDACCWLQWVTMSANELGIVSVRSRGLQNN